MPVAVPTGGSAADLAACARLLAGLPAQLGQGVSRRPVTGPPGRTAAWGDPPVQLRCGVAPPDPTIEPIVIDGVTWVVTHDQQSRLWVTRGRTVTVQVRVPDAYTSQAEQLTPLSDRLAVALPLTG